MIRLQRTVSINAFDTEATVSVGRDRPEFLAVARLAADLDRPIGARDVLRELLGNRPDVVGWKVIDRCVALGLLEREGFNGPAALSASGRLALEHGAVLVPEEGTWRLYYVDDPLIPEVLIHAERVEGASARDERGALAEARKRGDGRPPRPTTPPGPLASTMGAAPRASAARGYLFQLLSLGQGGADGDDATARLELTWEQEPVLRLHGNLPLPGEGPGLKIDAHLELPEVLTRIPREALWMALASHASGVSAADLQRWRAQAGALVLPARFADLSEGARRAFTQDLAVPASKWEKLGSFEATKLPGVRLVPGSDADAQSWFEWLQWEELAAYATPTVLDGQARALAARFPHHRPRPRSPAELLARARTERGDRAWNLLAPFDLGLWS